MRDYSVPRLKPEVLSVSEIQKRAERLTAVYAEQVGLEIASLGISFQAVYEEVIYPDYGVEIREGLELGHDEAGNKILGKYLPVENLVLIDRIISHDQNHPQRAFTYWHEVAGHGVLQGEWLREQLKRIKQESASILTTESSLNLATVSSLERQANIFAARAAAPDWLLYHVVVETMDLTRPVHYRGPSKYSLQVRGRTEIVTVKSFEHLCWIIGKRIQFRFGWLSAEALGYRIAETKLVKDCTEQHVELQRVVTQRKPITEFNSSFGLPVARMVS